MFFPYFCCKRNLFLFHYRFLFFIFLFFITVWHKLKAVKAKERWLPDQEVNSSKVSSFADFPVCPLFSYGNSFLGRCNHCFDSVKLVLITCPRMVFFGCGIFISKTHTVAKEH